MIVAAVSQYNNGMLCFFNRGQIRTLHVLDGRDDPCLSLSEVTDDRWDCQEFQIDGSLPAGVACDYLIVELGFINRADDDRLLYPMLTDALLDLRIESGVPALTGIDCRVAANAGNSYILHIGLFCGGCVLGGDMLNHGGHGECLCVFAMVKLSGVSVCGRTGPQLFSARQGLAVRALMSPLPNRYGGLNLSAAGWIPLHELGKDDA
ncbi:hypothetical protein D3C81_1102560 [compost metagenome]